MQSPEDKPCLGYLWMKGLDSYAAKDISEWICSLCLLRDGKIIHFDIDPKTLPRGKIHLVGAQVEVSRGAVPGALYSAADCFRLITPNRTFHIFAETHENRNKWVNLLCEHIEKLDVKPRSPPAPKNAKDPSYELKEQISAAERVEFLTKSGGIKNMSWKKRLFVLNGDYLVYYELPQGLRAQGNYECYSWMSISNCDDLPAAVSPESMMQIDSDYGKLLLGASSASDKKRWMESLMSKINDNADADKEKDGGGGGGDSSKLVEEKARLERENRELMEMKEKTDTIIRAIKNENRQLKEEIETLKVSVKEKDEGITQLTATMERMRIEVMEAHDANRHKG